MKIRSNLGRPIDPAYKTNLLILIFSVLTGAVASASSLYAGVGIIEALVMGIWSGGAVLAGWAIAREIDPDHEYSAFVGAAFSLAISQGNLLWIGPLIGVVWLARTVARTGGRPITLFDGVMMLGFIGYAAIFTIGWPLGLIMAIAFALDAFWAPPNRPSGIFAVLSLALTIGLVLQAGVGEIAWPDSWYLAVFAIVAPSFLVLILATKSITTRSDHNNLPLDLTRVRAAMSIALAIGIVSALWQGNGGIEHLAPLWGAMAGVVIYRIFSVIMKR